MSDAVTRCEHCGVELGAPHVRLERDCVMDHAEHTDREHGLICKRHWHWLGNTLTQIEELFALRGYVVEPATSSFGGDRPSGEVDPAVPGRIEIMAITDKRMPAPGWVQVSYERNWNGRTLETNGDDMLDAPGTLTSWARVVVEERGMDYPLDGSMAATIKLLRRERHWIAAQMWVDEYAAELEAVHRALAKAVGDSMWPRSIGKCPNCQTRLFSTIGADEVTCRKCRTVWRGVDLVRLCLIHEMEAVSR